MIACKKTNHWRRKIGPLQIGYTDCTIMVLQIVQFKGLLAVDVLSIMNQLAAIILAHTIENIMVEGQVIKLDANLVSASATTKLSRCIRSGNKNRIVAYFTGKSETIRIRAAVAGEAKFEAQRFLKLI